MEYFIVFEVTAAIVYLVLHGIEVLQEIEEKGF